MRVLSLFDGISTCLYVLDKVGVEVEAYYVSEIEPSAIAISRYRYHDRVTQLGDVTKITESDLDELGRIDLVAFGSPCIDLTAIKTNGTRTGLNGAGSGLYYEALRILRYLKPKWFFMENVVMDKQWMEQISNDLGVYPLSVDSNILTGANRPRLYWTNLPMSLPIPTHPKLREFMQAAEEVPKADWYPAEKYEKFEQPKGNVAGRLLVNCHEMGKRVYDPNGVCGTLTAINGGYNEKKVEQNGLCRKLTAVEYERLQGLPDGYTEYGEYEDGKIKRISMSKRRSACGNGWTVGVIEAFFKNLH